MSVETKRMLEIRSRLHAMELQKDQINDRIRELRRELNNLKKGEKQ